MSISIQTNVASLNAQYYINQNQNFQNTAIEQLSSGYKINSSADDPAGLAVANEYAGEITELTAGVQNAADGVSTLQIADGGLSNISQILGRLQRSPRNRRQVRFREIALRSTTSTRVC